MSTTLLLAAGSVAVANILWREEGPVVPLVVVSIIFAFGLVVAAVLAWVRPRLQLPHGVATGAVVLLVLSTLVLPMFLQIGARRAVAPYRYIHDGALQMEEAATMLDRGRNPYRENFRGTPLPLWSGKLYNPAVDHFVYLPGHLLLAVVAQKVFTPFLGFYDDRFLSFTAYLAALALVMALAPNAAWRLRAMIGVGLCPLIVPYLAQGRNDTVVFAFLALAWFFLARKRPLPAALAFAAAVTVKAFAWFLAPAFLTVLIAGVPGEGWLAKLRARWVPLALSALVVLAVLLPFVVWDPASFYDDAVRYPSGSSPTSYPIVGGGLSILLVRTGVVGSIYDYYPFWIFQLVLFAGLSALFLPRLARRPSPAAAALFGTLTLFAVMFTARFFTENHVGLLFLMATLTWVLYAREQRAGRVGAQVPG
jgi:hypothetical protein